MNHMHLSDAIENSNVMHGIRGCMCFPISRLHHVGDYIDNCTSCSPDRLTHERITQKSDWPSCSHDRRNAACILTMWMSSLKKLWRTLACEDPAGVVDPAAATEPH